MDKLQLEVLLKAIDQATAPIKAVREASKETAAAVREAKAALKELERQGDLIEQFRNTSKFIAITGNELANAQEKAQKLGQELAAVEKPTRAMTKAFEEAKKEVADLEAREVELITRKGKLREALDQSGISTTGLVAHQKQLKADIAAATAEVQTQSEALKVHNERMRAVNAAQAEYRKSIEFRNKLAVGGAVTMGAGVAMGAPILGAAKEAAAFEDAMLGVARQVDGAKDANGRYTQTYHDMAREIKAMSETIPLAAGGIAQIVEAGARMGIQGKDNLLTYAKLTATMSTAFDLPVDQVGENVAKLSQLYKIPIKDIHGLGDTINWLDDQALSKGGDIIDVMQRIAGTATTLKMDFKEAAALGSTFLSLGAGAEVAASASNAMMRELAVAGMQGKRFQSGVGMIYAGLVDDKKKLAELAKMDEESRGYALSGILQKNMSADATGTIIKVMDAIKALPEESRLEAATRLFGKEFGDDAAKMATNLDEYRRQLKLVNDEKAKGSMDKEMQSRLQTQNAQYDMLKNTIGNLSSDIGATLKPALVDLMQTVAGVLKGIRDWVREHPEWTATITQIAAVVATVTTALGALAVAVAAILGPFAAAKLAMTTLGVAAPGLVTGLGTLLNPLAKLAAAFTAGYTAGTLLNDGINALLTKIAGHKTTLGGLIYDMVQAVKAKVAELVAWFKKLPEEFLGIGNAIVDGIINGIKAKLGALKSTVTGLGKETVGWLKDTLGIKSPSRVFAEIGGYTMQGLEQGIAGGKGAPLSALAKMAKQLTAAGAGMMIGTAAIAGGIDNRPPLASGGMGGMGGMQVVIHVHPSAGMNEQNLAAEVARQVELIQRRQAASGRSRFGDRE